MPYAVPSPSTSPTATMSFAAPLPPAASPKSAPLSTPLASLVSATSPRREEKRPPRHHQRSHSSEPVASTSSFIFVQPSTPEGAVSASPSTYTWSSSSSSQPQDAFATIPRQARRIRLAAFTPAGASKQAAGGERSSSPSGPSSQEEDGARGRQQGDDDRTPRPSDALFHNSFPFGPNSSTASPDPTAEDDEWASKPALMVRKKSGELVRPSLKADTSRRDFSQPRSAPATPTCPKYVHFDTQLEHVKHFLAQQRPAAVSRSGSPVETETEDEPEAFPFPAMATAQAGTIKLVLPNFPPPSTRLGADAYVESLKLTQDGKSIRGIVHVQNLAFEKWVAVRFTLDNWQTVSEVSAEHHESLPGGKSDRFSFIIRLQDLLAKIEEKTMFLAVRYTIPGREIWDNNDNQNYRVEFKRVPPPPAAIRAAANAAASVAASRAAAASAAERRKNAWSVTNAGQAADRMADLKRELERLTRDDFHDDDDDVDVSSAAVSATGLGIGGSRAGGLRLGADARSYSEGAPSLSGRYDFGNSLKMYADRSGGTGGMGGMKEKAAGSPNLNVPMPLPNSSVSFFDPVSTSPSRPRAPPLPRQPASPTKPFGTTIINGMPATVYDPTLPSAPPSFINSHRGPSANASPLGSPKPQLQPDFGMTRNGKPASAASSSSQQQPSEAFYSPTLPTFQAAAPPPSSYFSGSPIAYLPLQDIPTSNGTGGFSNGGPRTRYHSDPSTFNPSASRSAALPYSPLVPPAFRSGRSQNSPFASPAPSPPNGASPAGSPPRPSNLGLRSPPPERMTSDSETETNDQLWSPDSAASTTSSTSSHGTVLGGLSPFPKHGRREGSQDSTSSLLSSPGSESDATSVGASDSPPYGGGKPLPFGERTASGFSNPSDFLSFLSKYQASHLHSGTSSPAPHGSSLGLSQPASYLSSPNLANNDFFSSFNSSSNSSNAPSPIGIVGRTSPSSGATSMAGSPTPPSSLSPLAHAAAQAAVSPGPPPATGRAIVS